MWTLSGEDEDISNLTTEDALHQSILAAQYVTVTPGIDLQIHHWKHPHTIHHWLIWFCPPPFLGKRVIQTTEEAIECWLHCITHTHAHTIMMCEKAKISSNPANWDSHLFDPLGLVKSPATKSVSLQKQTFSYGKMSQNYKITELCFHFLLI